MRDEAKKIFQLCWDVLKPCYTDFDVQRNTSGTKDRLNALRNVSDDLYVQGIYSTIVRLLTKNTKTCLTYNDFQKKFNNLYKLSMGIVNNPDVSAWGSFTAEARETEKYNSNGDLSFEFEFVCALSDWLETFTKEATA